MTTGMSHEFERLYENCKHHAFDSRSIAEQMWNAGYALGRRRWYWGPQWFLPIYGKINTLISRWRGGRAE